MPRMLSFSQSEPAEVMVPDLVPEIDISEVGEMKRKETIGKDVDASLLSFFSLHPALSSFILSLKLQVIRALIILVFILRSNPAPNRLLLFTLHSCLILRTLLTHFSLTSDSLLTHFAHFHISI